MKNVFTDLSILPQILISGTAKNLSISNLTFSDSMLKNFGLLDITVENFVLENSNFVNLSIDSNLPSFFKFKSSSVDGTIIIFASNFENIYSSDQIFIFFDGFGDDLVNFRLIECSFNLLQTKSLIKFVDVQTDIILERNIFSNIVSFSSILETDSQNGGISISLKEIAFINNLSPKLLLFSSGRSLQILNVTITNNNKNISNKSILGGPILFIRNFCSVVLANIIVKKFYSFEETPGIIFLQTKKMADFFTEEYLSNNNQFYLVNSKFIRAGLFSNFNGEYTKVVLHHESLLKNTLIIDNCKFNESNDERFSGLDLIGIYNLLSYVFIKNIEISDNSNLFGILEIASLHACVTNSSFERNTRLAVDVINYLVNYLEENNVIINNNQAQVSTIEIGPFDKSTFQFYFGDKIFCSSNLVNLFGACYQFKPTYNGNYTLNNSIFMNSISYYLAGAIDVFCANPTFLPTFYIFANSIFKRNWAAKESGAIFYFFHDSIYSSYLVNCIFEENSSITGGVMIVSLDNRSNKLFITNCSFIGNHAVGGGALSIVSGKVTILEGCFINNSAVRAGSIEALNYNLLNISNVLFLDSVATKYAGVILIIDNIDLYMSNVTVINSFSTFGGFIYSDAHCFIDFRKGFLKNCSGNNVLFISKNIKEKPSYFYEVRFETIKAVQNCFFIDSSALVFDYCFFNDFSSILFFISSSSLNFNNSVVEKGYCYHESDEGCLFRSQSDTLIVLYNVNISKLDVFAYGGIFFTSESQIYFMEGSIIEILNSFIGSFVYALNSVVFVERVFLRNIKNDLLYGYLSNFTMKELYLANNKTEIFDYSAITLDSCHFFGVDRCYFQNFHSSKNGGLIYISNQDSINDPIYKIQNSNFTDIVGSYGGVIYLENTRLSLFNSTFKGNFGVDGGAIYYFCNNNDSLLCDLDVMNNTFESNIASNHGGALKWLYKKPSNLNSNIFLNNFALNYGNNIANFPIRLSIQIKNNNNISIHDESEEFIILNRIKSGQKFEAILEILLFDDLNQQVKNVSNAKMYVDEIKDPEIIKILSNRFNITVNLINTSYSANLIDIAGQTSQNINENSSFIFDDLTATATPSSKIFLSFTSSLIKKFRPDLLLAPKKNDFNDSNNNYVFYLPLSIDTCVIGEIYDYSSNTCRACPKGTFSFEIFSGSCENCFENAICNGGNEIIIPAGYWRANNYSKNVYKCDRNLNLCKGGINSSCEAGYYGNLCEVCQSKNGQRWEKNYFGLCQECDNLGVDFLITFCLAVGIGMLIKFLASFFLKKEKTIHDVINCSLIKLLIMHYQILILLPNINLSLENTTNEYISSLIKNWFSFDCIFNTFWGFKSSLNNRLFSASFIFIIEALIFTFFLFKCRKLQIHVKLKNNPSIKQSCGKNEKKELNKKNISNYLKEKNNESQNYTVTIITYNTIFFYLAQAYMVDLSFLGFRCFNIENKSYSRYSLDYECWTNDHLYWIYLCYIPNLIFWIFILTYLFYYFLKKAKQYNAKNIIIASVGFKRRYKWKGDVFNLGRRTVMVIASTFLSENSGNLAFTIFLLTAFILMMHFYFKPYNYKILNRIDSFSLYIVFITYFNLSYYYIEINQELKISKALYSFLIFLNSLYLFVWLVVFFRRSLKKIIGVFQRGREIKIMSSKVQKKNCFKFLIQNFILIFILKIRIK